MAAGKVLTGFSKPYVATYSASGTTVTYTNGQLLARGVSVSLSPEASDSNDFYADNTIAESIGGTFSGGTVTLTVDGLKASAQKLIRGLASPSEETVGSDTVSVYSYDDDQTVPYVGIGFIARFMEDGVASYVGYILPKTRFSEMGLEASTQEDAIEFQTQELEADLFRDDSAKHSWQKFTAELTTEDAAEAWVKKTLSIA